MKSLLIAAIVLCCASIPLFSQDINIQKADVETTYAVKQGRTKAVRDIISKPATPKDKRSFAKKDRMIPKNFVGRYPSREIKNNKTYSGVDPIRQSEVSPLHAAIPPLVNIDGLLAGGSPQDPSGDVGLNYYLQMINATRIGVFSKAGELISTFTGNSLWNQIGISSGGDPIVLFDQDAERWILTEFPTPFGQGSRQLLVAVSVTEDPLGSYDVYNFATVRFPDYPKYSVWNNAYAVTTNEEGPSVLHGYFINREELLNGDSIVSIQRVGLPGSNSTEAGFFVATPVDWTGKVQPIPDQGPMLVSLNDASWNSNQSEDQIEIFSLELNWRDPDSTRFVRQSVPVSPYDSYPCSESGFGFECVPQLDGGGLDAIPEVIMNQVHYRNFESHESMVMTFITDVTEGENFSGIRWLELRRTDSLNWQLYQEGTFSPDDGLERFMSTICMDGDGNIGLAYCTTSDTSYVGIRYTGRRSRDPLGVMTFPETLIAEGRNAVFSGARFGDYPHMTVDPVDDRTFWFTTEYANGGTSYTRIAAFVLARDTFDLAAKAVLNPESSSMLTASETIQFEVQNTGKDTVDEFSVGYILNGAEPVIDSVDFTLLPDSTYLHTFDQQVDLSAIGNYDLSLFSFFEKDRARFNDTLRVNILKTAFRDVVANSILGVESLICGDSVDVGIVIVNNGTDTLSSMKIELVLNDQVTDTIDWVGSIPPFEIDTFMTSILEIADGENSFSAILSEPNGLADQNASNDTIKVVLNSVENTVPIQFELTFDRFPNETSWVIESLQGDTIAQGEDYGIELGERTIFESLCLEADSCYIFRINDAFGDGFFAFGIAGGYSFLDESGTILANNLTPEFGRSEEIILCAQFTCNIQTTIDFAPDEGNGNGVIMATVTNGVSPFQYSIDGGITFQSENTFNNLSAGSYDLVITDFNDCSYNETIEIEACTGSLDYGVLYANGSDSTATVTILTTDIESINGYSLDGGSTFQESAVFDSIPTGNYNVVVNASNGCTYEDEVEVQLSTSTSAISLTEEVNIYPNPTEGQFIMELSNLTFNEVFVGISIFDLNGKLIQRSQLTRYNDSYKGMISLYQYPQGQYLIKVHHPEVEKLYRVSRL